MEKEDFSEKISDAKKEQVEKLKKKGYEKPVTDLVEEIFDLVERAQLDYETFGRIKNDVMFSHYYLVPDAYGGSEEDIARELTTIKYETIDKAMKAIVPELLGDYLDDTRLALVKELIKNDRSVKDWAKRELGSNPKVLEGIRRSYPELAKLIEE